VTNVAFEIKKNSKNAGKGYRSYISFTDCAVYHANRMIYEVWNFNSGNYLFTTDTK